MRVNDLPVANQIVDLPRQYMRVLEDGEEEKECDHGQDKEKDTTDDCHGKGPTKKPDHPEKASVNAFLSLSPAEQKVATTYVHRHGKDGKQKVVWEILGDDEQITQDAMDPELIKQSPFKKDIPWDADRKNVDYNKIFFDDFLPDLSGKAALLLLFSMRGTTCRTTKMSLAIVPRRSSPAQQLLTCSTSFYHSLTSITRQDRAILHWRDAG